MLSFTRLKIFCALFFLFSLNAGESPIDLRPYETSLYSENGEDGILAALFQRIGISSRYCVELGASDGITHSNTYLLRLQGWGSLLLDRAHKNEPLKVHKEFVTKENLNSLLQKYKVPTEIDLLSIRIPYNSFYLWKELNEIYRPSVVLIVYNGYLTPQGNSARVVPYHPYFCGDGSHFFGADILALQLLGKKKGYTLIYVESQGKNLFLLRDDLIEKNGFLFKDMGNPYALYRPPFDLKNDTDFESPPFCSYEEAMKR